MGYGRSGSGHGRTADSRRQAGSNARMRPPASCSRDTCGAYMSMKHPEATDTASLVGWLHAQRLQIRFAL